MGDIAVARRNVKEEEVRYLAAVSESTFFKIGGSANFINKRQHDEKGYFLNGRYGSITSFPQLGLDGLYVFPFDAEIINYAMFNNTVGSGGTTELDIKRATTSGGAFTSLFSVTPKIASTSSAFTFFLGYTITDILTGVGQSWTANATPPTGVTVGTFTTVPFNVSAGDAIRVDILGAMTNAENAGLVVHFRPR